VGDLILAFLCSGSISLIFKYSESANLNRYVVTTINYVIATIMGIAFALQVPYEGFDDGMLTFARFLKGSQMGPGSSMTWALMVGMITGILFFMTFITYQVSVRKYGPSITGMFGKLGILVPMLLSVYLFHEYPSHLQLVGILLSFISIVLINLSKDLKWEIKGILIVFFFLGGMAEFMNKIYQKYSMIEFKPVFLLTVFATALMVSLIKTLPYIRSITAKDIWVGVLVGVPNYFSSFFLINALRELPTSVVFPVYSAGSILTIIIASHYLFKEVYSAKKITAIVLTIVAIVLINI
jgi:drug/metabolite transporter (DMT)-like permease